MRPGSCKAIAENKRATPSVQVGLPQCRSSIGVRLNVPKLESPGLVLTAVGITVLAVILFVPPLHQDVSYHSFADQRTIWNIPNFLNVASNLPFLAVGFLALWFIEIQSRNRQIFLDPRE